MDSLAALALAEDRCPLTPAPPPATPVPNGPPGWAVPCCSQARRTLPYPPLLPPPPASLPPPPPRGWQGFREPALPSSPEDQRAPGAEPWAQAVFMTLERSRPWGQGPPWVDGQAGTPHPPLGLAARRHPATWRAIPSLGFSFLLPTGSFIHRWRTFSVPGAVSATSPGLPAPRWPLLQEVCPALPTVQAGPRAPLWSPGLLCLLQLGASQRLGPVCACPRGAPPGRVLSLQRPVLNRAAECWGEVGVWGR